MRSDSREGELSVAEGAMGEADVLGLGRDVDADDTNGAVQVSHASTGAPTNGYRRTSVRNIAAERPDAPKTMHMTMT